MPAAPTRPSVLAACFEALAGALSLSEGTERAEAILEALFAPRLDGAVRHRRAAQVGQVAAPGVEPAASGPEADLSDRRQPRGRRTSSASGSTVAIDGRIARLRRRLQPPAGRGAGGRAQRWHAASQGDGPTAADGVVSRLKELRLHGFKSFADPTRFVFEPGVNAVIGPNGSGKSNMADAVRWVLGEQSNRSLRTRRADDVIFGGSDQRRPQGMAEAILTLDNADGWLPIDFAEVVDRAARLSVRRERVPHQRRAGAAARRGRAARRRAGWARTSWSSSGRGRSMPRSRCGPRSGASCSRRRPASRASRCGATRRRAASTEVARQPDPGQRPRSASSSRRSDASRCRPSTSSSTTRSARGRGRWCWPRTGAAERAARAALGEARRRSAAADAALDAYRRGAGRRPGGDRRGRGALLGGRGGVASRQRPRGRRRARSSSGSRAGSSGRERESDAAAGLAQAEAGARASSSTPRGVRRRSTAGEAVDPALAAAAAAERAWQAAVEALAGGRRRAAGGRAGRRRAACRAERSDRGRCPSGRGAQPPARPSRARGA